MSRAFQSTRAIRSTNRVLRVENGRRCFLRREWCVVDRLTRRCFGSGLENRLVVHCADYAARHLSMTPEDLVSAALFLNLHRFEQYNCDTKHSYPQNSIRRLKKEVYTSLVRNTRRYRHIHFAALFLAAEVEVCRLAVMN